ncbi:MAG: hypothetical protein ACE5G5_10850 [Candidatus Methylomirabilales bacterium]
MIVYGETFARLRALRLDLHNQAIRRIERSNEATGHRRPLVSLW